MLNKICKICKEIFVWEDIDLELFKKFGFEPYDTCNRCLHMQKLAFRNERVFYKRECDGTKEEIISIYHPKSPYKVYKSDYFWSDKWSPYDYGQEYDFNRPFFEQFAELKLRVPRLAIHNAKAENSDYCNTSFGNKNSYMIFGGDYNEESMFGVLCDKNKFCMDLDYSFKGELLYFCSDTANCYDCHYVFNSKVSSNCYFCEELSGCSECILCFNLKNQKYYIRNKKYSEEEYFAKKKELINGSLSTYKALFEEFLNMRKSVAKKYAHIIGCIDCEGDYIVDSKNCTNCFDVARSEDCRNVIYGSQIKNCFLCDMMGLGCELCFNSVSVIHMFNGKFCFWVGEGSDLTYCDFCMNSHNCFGCIGLNHGEYCILNKKYSKEEYEELVPKIIKHMGGEPRIAGRARTSDPALRESDAELKNKEWGKFFPANLSCFGYNETTAHLYFPLDKEKALLYGFNWRDEEGHEYKAQSYIVPDNISDVGDDILNAVLGCKTCKRNFKILKQELNWYKKHLVPIPDECFNCRMKKRANLRNPRKLWERKCSKCGTEVKTTYSPDKKDAIYCEKCYFEIVY